MLYLYPHLLEKAQSHNENLNELLLINPDLDLDVFKKDLTNYYQSNALSIDYVLKQCLRRAAANEPMPWEK